MLSSGCNKLAGTLFCTDTAVCALGKVLGCHIVFNMDSIVRTILFTELTAYTAGLAEIAGYRPINIIAAIVKWR